jgi:hypothetical protein
MHILQIISHSPESCPLGNPKNLELKLQWLENLEKNAAKHGIMVVGVWTDRSGHCSWAVYEAPNMEAFSKFELEPQNLARVTFSHIDSKLVTPAKDTLGFFNQYKKDNKT